MVNYIKLSIFAQQCFCGQFITGNNKTPWSLCTVPVTALKHKNVRLIHSIIQNLEVKIYVL